MQSKKAIQNVAKGTIDILRIQTAADFETVTDALLYQLIRIANAVAPKRRPASSFKAWPHWNQECANLTREAKRARRKFTKLKTNEFNEVKKRAKRAAKKARLQIANLE